MTGHEVAWSTVQTGEWPRGVREYYPAPRSEVHHVARCSCGWSGESSALVVVQHLVQDHLASITEGEKS